ADDFINVFLLRIVAIHTMIADARRQAMPMLAQLLLVEVDPGVFQRSLSGFLARRGLCTAKRKSPPPCDVPPPQGANLHPPFGPTSAAIEEVPETERLLTTLGDEGRIMSGDQFRVRGKRRHQHALMKVGPVKRLPKLPCNGTFRVVAIATQVAEIDATA